MQSNPPSSSHTTILLSLALGARLTWKNPIHHNPTNLRSLKYPKFKILLHENRFFRFDKSFHGRITSAANIINVPEINPLNLNAHRQPKLGLLMMAWV